MKYIKHQSILATTLACLLPICTSTATAGEPPRIPWIKPEIPDVAKYKQALLPEEQKATPEISAEEQERHAFKHAFEAMQMKQYQQAIGAYQHLVDKNPESKFAAQSLYWIGEANYFLHNYDSALENYAHVMIYHPDSPTALQAALKSGIVFIEQENWERAKKSLGYVISEYPGSIPAQKAKKHLKLVKHSLALNNPGSR